MKKRKFWAAAAVMACILMLTACKQNVGTPEDNAAASDDSEEETQEQYLIGFSVIDMENPYFQTMEHAAQEAVEEEGHRLMVKDPASDPELQAAQISEMIEAGIDVMVLSPVDWEEIMPSLEELKSAGIAVVNVDTQVKDMRYVEAYIGSDNYSAGLLCGQELAEHCPEGGEVAILECPDQNSMNERITGFEEALLTSGAGFKVVAREDTGGEYERALEVSMRILQEYPDLRAIMCGNDQLAMGAKEALDAFGSSEALIYSVDGSPDIKKELADPVSPVAATAAQSPINMGRNAVRTAISILEGESYESMYYEEVFLISKDNIEMYGVDGWQ